MERLPDIIKRDYPEIDAWIRETDDHIVVKKIVVPPDERNRGVGSEVMRDVTRYADRNEKTVSLTPSTDFGATSRSRLRNFYSDFGFVRNRGSDKDFKISETMYRRPR